MQFRLPKYETPDFTVEPLAGAPNVNIALVELDGVAPEYFHSTSMYPEYFKVDGQWLLARQSRMDSCVEAVRLLSLFRITRSQTAL